MEIHMDNESAFDEIMKEMFHSLVFFIDRYVHDVHAAEDIAIDVLADLIVHKHRYHFGVTLKTYLFMLGRSRALDYNKHHKVTSDEKTLEEIVLADERKRAVNAALAKLPEAMRVVIHLIYFENMTYEQAAKVMKKNRKQVDNLIYRAKKELRILLGEEGEQFQ